MHASIVFTLISIKRFIVDITFIEWPVSWAVWLREMVAGLLSLSLVMDTTDIWGVLMITSLNLRLSKDRVDPETEELDK